LEPYKPTQNQHKSTQTATYSTRYQHTELILDHFQDTSSKLLTKEWKSFSQQMYALIHCTWVSPPKFHDI